ncbi:MAG: S1 family peptidase [Candidatus Nanopelagicales bacterium]
MKRLRSVVLASALALLSAGVVVPALPAQASARSIDGQPTSRIVGGARVNQSRTPTPWYVLLKPHLDSKDWVCGGTAVSSRWIVTAAHCVFGQSPSDIAASEAYLNPAGWRREAVIRWKSIYVHPSYNDATEENDIALIATATAMPVATLPYTASNSGPSLGTAMTAFGFGRTSDGGYMSQFLRSVAIQDEAGQTGSCGQYGNTYKSRSMICGGIPQGGADSCQGDSGGPLTAWAGKETLVGIVSWGNGCGRAGFPGIYTRVSTYASWIGSTTGVAGNPIVASRLAPAKLVAAKPCKSRTCKLQKGRSLRLGITNIGGSSASWRVSTSKLTRSKSAGTLHSGRTTYVKVKAKTKKRTCAKVSVVSGGHRLTSFRVALNGAKC